MNKFLDCLQQQTVNLWQKAADETDNDGVLGREKKKTSEFWDNMAESKQSDAMQDSQRINDIIDVLERKELCYQGLSCLDVGCGRGEISKELAMRDFDVDLYDISPRMLNITLNRLRYSGFNAKTYEGSWHDDDLVARGFKSKYDLVICALNPAVTNSVAIDKINYCSRAWCMYIYSAGGCIELERQALDIKILGHPLENSPFNEVIFPLNYLYCSGYYPELSYTSSDWIKKSLPDDELRTLINLYSHYTDLDKSKQSTIENYVHDHTYNGYFKSSMFWHQGILLWKVK